MGIPGILKEIGKGERIALTKLAVEHLEKNQRPLRIAIDVAIWNFQNQAGQGGKNPALRTLFFRLLRLLALPIHPVFVYDGRNKPLTKRGRTVTRYTSCIPNETSKKLVQAFRFPYHIAPGEAEAECAFLQRHGVVDAVMSQDVDAIMFGSTVTLRDWSKEGTRGNKSPTHVNLLESSRIKMISGLDPDGMILVALLSGGDYDEDGVPGFGTTLACEVARAGFGTDLLELVRNDDQSGLDEWRQRLQYELETNESGYFKKRHKTLQIPHSFPNTRILGYYMNPAVSNVSNLSNLKGQWDEIWKSEIDVPALREYTAQMFDWSYRPGARRFIRCFAQPLFQNKLTRGTANSTAFSVSSISEKRHHFINDGIPELRLSVTPADVVAINLEAEEDSPEYISGQMDEDEADGLVAAEEVVGDVANDNEPPAPLSPSRRKRSPPWNPYAVEKWWIPETLLQLGLPKATENWHQLQRDVRADPKKFATRNASRSKKGSSKIDSSMKSGAIRGFFKNVHKQIELRQSQESTKSETECDAPRVSAPEPSAFLTDNTTDAVSNISKSSHETLKLKAFRSASRQGQEEAGAHCAIPSVRGEIDKEATLLTQQDMDWVTRRKNKQQRPRPDAEPSSAAKSPVRKPRPIESFFPQSKPLPLATDPKDNFIVSSTDSEKVVTVPAPSHSSENCLSSSQKAAFGRESLPGTWREIEAGNLTGTSASRVSFIDLTSD